LADLFVSDVLVGVLLVGVGTALSEQLLVVLGLEVFPAQWAIGSAHGGVSFDSGDYGEPVLTNAAMLAFWRLRGNTNAPGVEDALGAGGDEADLDQRANQGPRRRRGQSAAATGALPLVECEESARGGQLVGVGPLLFEQPPDATFPLGNRLRLVQVKD